MYKNASYSGNEQTFALYVRGEFLSVLEIFSKVDKNQFFKNL